MKERRTPSVVDRCDYNKPVTEEEKEATAETRRRETKAEFNTR